MLRFNEFVKIEICESASAGLAAKAKKSGISIGTLRKVYRRGVAADRGSPVNEAALITDVPREEWLENKIAYAKKRGRDRFGVPYMDSTTAYVKLPSHVVLPVSVLARIPGARGEQKNVRQGDLAAIMKIMQDTGKLPLDKRGEEYMPFIGVAWNGEPWVLEGNHRIMAADRLGWNTLPVELKYFDGGERVKSGLLYPGKIGLR